jgi:hypothetical protein
MGLLEGMFNNINKNWGLYTGALLRGLWREELPVLQGLGLVERTVTRFTRTGAFTQEDHYMACGENSCKSCKDSGLKRGQLQCVALPRGF